jgi:hypothetical protein
MTPGMGASQQYTWMWNGVWLQASRISRISIGLIGYGQTNHIAVQ